MKYNVGDKVRVRKDLVIGSCSDNEVTSEMLKYRGKEMEIQSVLSYGYTLVNEPVWMWEDDMFETL